MNKSFFEYLGLADVERIHSQFLAWILSEDCNAIDKQNRERLLQNLFNVLGEITEIQTERNRIDILIATSTEVIIVENKIKSSQHSNQLQNYKVFCDTTFPNHKKHYFFLTLIDERTNVNDWKRLTYSKIFEYLKTIKLKPNNNHSSIISEYLIFLKRLNDVVSDFEDNTANYDMVFLDGKKKKQDKKRSDYVTENEWFIAANQLETILQKSFLNKFVQKFQYRSVVIQETRGDALVDFLIQSAIEFNGKKYSTALQLQGSTVKFTFAIQSEPYLKSKKNWIEKMIPLMSQLSIKNKYGYKKLNKPKELAYVSISKKLEWCYWHKPIHELTIFIQTEIENCNQMTIELKKLLTKIANTNL